MRPMELNPGLNQAIKPLSRIREFIQWVRLHLMHDIFKDCKILKRHV